MEVVSGLFFVALAAVFVGVLGRLLKLPALIGYIVVGIIFGAILPPGLKSISNLAEIGTILLLFSIGLELSFDRLSKFFKVAILGAIIQIILVTFLGYLLLNILGLGVIASLILALGFSMSSTAVVVKLLLDKGELETIHGGIMFGWLLVQDLSVIPVMVMLPFLASGSSVGALLLALFKASIVVSVVTLAGKLIVPKIIHFVSEANSRELLLLTSVALALGTAIGLSFFGVSASIGAFLAGIVISESQEHHAIFAETRPLRDLFVALFFVTLGFIVDPAIVFSNLKIIILIASAVLVVKALAVFFINQGFGFRGRTAVAVSFGLAQVGEFAFVIFSVALSLKLLNATQTSIGIAVTLLSLIFSPLLFDNALTVWRWLKKVTAQTRLSYLFSSGEKQLAVDGDLSEHVIICGYGRVGKWIGRALSDFEIPFIVVEYNQKIVSELKEGGVSVLYGDPTEPEVLEAAGIRNAKAVILAIPDRVAQETLIAYVQTVASNVKIIGRAHQDADWERLKSLRVDKIVQPEFEAAIEIIRSMLTASGKSKEDIGESIRRLRMSHSWIS